MDGHRVVLFRTQGFRQANAGLFKVEWCGDGFVGLCSKTYYCFGATDKYSTKGLSKHHNDIDEDTFLAVQKTDVAVVDSIGLSRARFVRDDVHSRASRTNLLLREAQSTRRRSQHGASGSVKGSDNQTTIHSPTWIRAGNTLSRASSPDRLVVVRQR